MYIGTIHSLCQRLLVDRRFTPQRRRPKTPLLHDDLDQYLLIYRKQTWNELLADVNWHDANKEINLYFEGKSSRSRHRAVTNCIGLFNRLSEECLNPDILLRRVRDRKMRKLIQMYAGYRNILREQHPPLTDFALLQQAALETLQQFDSESGVNAWAASSNTSSSTSIRTLTRFRKD